MPFLDVKDGVQPRGLVDIFCAASAVSVEGQPAALTITAVIDGVHSRKSRHYYLAAVDFRSKDFPSLAVKQAWVAVMKTELGPDYDVVLENVGKANEHFHVEFDPK